MSQQDAHVQLPLYSSSDCRKSLLFDNGHSHGAKVITTQKEIFLGTFLKQTLIASIH